MNTDTLNTGQATADYAGLNAILDQARRPSRAPTSITVAQLRGLQHRWTTMLSARLDQALEDAGGPLSDAATGAWRQLAADQPVLRGVLDDGLRRLDTPADLADTEFRMLALTAGLAGLDDPEHRAAALGRELHTRLRAELTLHQVA